MSSNKDFKSRVYIVTVTKTKYNFKIPKCVEWEGWQRILEIL